MLQYNSDTNHPELSSDSTGLRTQPPTRLPSFQEPAASSRVPKPPILLTDWLQIQAVPTADLKFNNLLDWLIELKNLLHLKL